MEPRANHVLIGLFTLLAAAAAIVFALWLAKAHQQGRVQHYVVVFNEPLRGLSRGAAVLYNGIRIGEVEGLRLNPADLRQAEARIAIDAEIPVREDTRARLVLTGITGVSVIELSGGSPLSPLLLDSEDDDQVPEIIATPSPLTQLLAGGDHLMSSVSELVFAAREVFSPANLAHISNILHSVDTLTASLAEQGDGLTVLMDSFTGTSEQAADVLKQLGELLESTRTLLAVEGGATFEHARNAMESLETASETLARMIRNNEGAVASGARGLSELGPALHALRETLLSIQRVTRRLEENPGNYLLGRDKVQEFEP